MAQNDKPKKRLRMTSETVRLRMTSQKKRLRMTSENLRLRMTGERSGSERQATKSRPE
jgi:hypothetical protein